MNTLHELVLQQARQRPQAPYALAVEGGSTLDYGALAAHCRGVGALLQDLGVAQGETVSLVMPNGLHTLLLLLGTMVSGRCVNPVNLLSQPEQMAYVLGHSDTRCVFVAPEWEAPVRGMLRDLQRPVLLRVVDPHLLPAPGATHDEQPDWTPPRPDDLALLMYTSGTTGQPKGVMLTQASLVANAMAISREHGLGPHDRVLGVLPLYHINAFVVTMLAPLAHGGSVVSVPRFSTHSFWAQATEHGCSWINLVPTIISFLLESAAPPQGSLAGIRFCRSASSALRVDLLHAFEKRFGIGVVETMGLTETAAPSFANPMTPALRKPGSVGRASGCEARVVDAVLRPVADGTTGEIVIRGPNVMRGYYKNEQATQDAFTPDGWLRTGDLGHRDADGFFFVTGRIKELIIKGGENIAPREIDEAVLRHPAVLDAAAVGIDDPHYGQDIMVCVVLRTGQVCGEDELRAFCQQQLGRYKSPRVIRFVDDLPRGPSGKVQRLKLAPLVG